MLTSKVPECTWIRIYGDRHTLSHNLWTSFSASCLQFIKLSIQPSRVGIDAGSVAGDNLCGSGAFPMSKSIFESIIDSFRVDKREGTARIERMKTTRASDASKEFYQSSPVEH